MATPTHPGRPPGPKRNSDDLPILSRPRNIPQDTPVRAQPYQTSQSLLITRTESNNRCVDELIEQQMTETFSRTDQLLADLSDRTAQFVRLITNLPAVTPAQHSNHRRRDTTIAVVVESPSIKNGTNIPTEELVHTTPGAKLPAHTDGMTLHTGYMMHHTDNTHYTDKRTLQANEIKHTDTMRLHTGKILHTYTTLHTDKGTTHTKTMNNPQILTDISHPLAAWYKQMHSSHKKPNHRKQRPRLKCYHGYLRRHP
jgi:hypothetical protein